MKILVTGATGFLGGAAARTLHQRGHEVRATGRDAAKGQALQAQGVAFVAADLSRRDEALALCEGVEAVCHCAALSSPWGSLEAFMQANVAATAHIVEGCERLGVKRLVHISTPSIYNNGRNRAAVSEDAPLPTHQRNHYAHTKLLAEGLVMAATRRGLWGVILRPRAIFGPGDTTLMPRLVRALRAKRLPQIGAGRNWADLTYIDNAVEAISCALDAPSEVSGRPFNITNGEPRLMWEVIKGLCDALGYPRPNRTVPYPVMYGVAALIEASHALLRRPGEPVLTRQGVDALALNMTLDIRAAKESLGYRPIVGVDEGLSRFIAWWRSCHEAP